MHNPHNFAVAQNFVDTGVRACKSGAAALIAVKDVLKVALNIHSVAARHSARIRSFRRGGVQSTTAPKSWVMPGETPGALLPNNGVPGTVATVSPYNPGSPAAMVPAESNVSQANLTVTSYLPAGGSATAAAEPLDAATVKAIAKNFAANPAALFNWGSSRRV